MKSFIQLKEEGRIRTIGVSQDVIENLLLGYHSEAECHPVPEFTGLPRGAMFLGVFFNNWDRCFCIHVMHEDFSPVEPGAEIPRLGGWLSTKYTVWRKLEDVRRPV